MSDFHSRDAGPLASEPLDVGRAAARNTALLMRQAHHDDTAIYETLDMLGLLPGQDPDARHTNLPLRDHDKEASCRTTSSR